MKLIRTLVGCLLAGILVVTVSINVYAEESWAVDNETKCQICWVSDVYNLVKATWYGPKVDGKAEGKGTLIFTIHEKDSGKDREGRGKCEMKAGKLDGKVSIKFKDGDSYEGLYKDGLKEGKGVYKWSDGKIYDGEWKKGWQEGKGNFTYPKVGVYQGDFKNGQREGNGVLRFKNGVVYDGQWRNDCRNGRGTFKNKNGKTIYDGQWQNDSIIQQENWYTDSKSGCRICWVNANWILVNAVWTGSAVNNQAEGSGTLSLDLISPAGVEIKGTIAANMKNGKINGHVNAHYSNGLSFNGTYREGLIEGQGFVKYPNGESYEGDWKNNLPEGKGVYKSPDGIVYEGDWKNGCKDGKGFIKYQNGDKYQGDFKNNYANGQGVYTWSDGRGYVGGWKDGGRNGYGVYKQPNGTIIYDGLWKDDLIVNLKKTGTLYL